MEDDRDVADVPLGLGGEPSGTADGDEVQSALEAARERSSKSLELIAGVNRS